MKAQLLLIMASIVLGGCSTLREAQDVAEPPQTWIGDDESGIRTIRAALTSLSSGKGSNKSFREMDASVGVHVARVIAGGYLTTGTNSDVAMRRHREMEKLRIENTPYRLSSVDSITRCRLPFSLQTRSSGYSLDMIVGGVAERHKLSTSTLKNFFTTKDKGWVDEVIYWLVLYAKCQPEVESASARHAFRKAEWARLTEGSSFGNLTVAPSPPVPCFDWDETDDARWAPISNEAIKYVQYLRCADCAEVSYAMSGEEALFWAVVFIAHFKSTAGAKELNTYRERHAENPQSEFWLKAVPIVENFDTKR